MVDAKTRELYKNHITRIYTANDEVKGSGLLICNQYIITCAHVVADALNIRHLRKRIKLWYNRIK